MSAAGSIAWKCPSNIALIKYWGKHGQQLPRNPSLSMTLRESVTHTTIIHKAKAKNEASLSFSFDGKPAPDFEQRIKKYLESISTECPFIKNLDLDIQSKNTFPHSSGIASSAAAFGALALGILSIEDQLENSLRSENEFRQQASHLARLGSGSASRSVYGNYAVWGASNTIGNTYSDLYAQPLESKVHPVFLDMQDAILIVSGAKKKVGSSAGHALMDGHDYANARYEQAHQNLIQLMEALSLGDMESYMAIVENEALSLHAMMMASRPGYMLMEANTLAIIERIRSYRAETGVPVCFTLDAGPNVHLLYPASHKSPVMDLINEELLLFCASNQWIDDGIGEGPVAII